jgi:hypothetical protein
MHISLQRIIFSVAEGETASVLWQSESSHVTYHPSIQWGRTRAFRASVNLRLRCVLNLVCSATNQHAHINITEQVEHAITLLTCIREVAGSNLVSSGYPY